MRSMAVSAVGAVAILLSALGHLASPVGAAPGDPCPAARPIEGVVDQETVDDNALNAERNHLVWNVGWASVDYLSSPGETLSDSIAAMAGQATFIVDPDTRFSAETIERSVLVSLRRTADVLACVDGGAGEFVEAELTDGRLLISGDLENDPGNARVSGGYVLVTTTRLRTERPVVEVAVTSTAPTPPAATTPRSDRTAAPAGDPIGAQPPFVG